MFRSVKIVKVVVEFELLTYSFVENALDNSLRYHKTLWALLDFTPQPVPYSFIEPNTSEIFTKVSHN